MDNKHTQGPWAVESDRSISAPAPPGSDCITPRITICDVLSGGPGVEAADANARLINASLDLLDALQTLHDVCLGMDSTDLGAYPTEEEYFSAMAQAAAAIAKAIGGAQ